MKSRETLIRLKKFQVDERRRKVMQIESMIAEFERMANDLEREIKVEQDRAGAQLAQSLGDERHGNWVLLTIAVVIRAGHGLTRQRRDDRVIGTLIGCVLAAGSVAYLPLGALVAVQGFAVTVVHSFARLNYRISSTAASVMAI